MFTDKTILVAGVTGTIGRAVTDALLARAPRAIRGLSRNAKDQFWMQRRYKGRQVRFILGSIEDRDRLLEMMDGVDYVINAAAYKHVGQCEYNPDAAESVNVGGLRNLLYAAGKCGVQKVLHVSTDKVARVSGVMAACKLLAEAIARTRWHWRDKPEVVCVRMGNILMSSGSLGEIIVECVKRGDPWPLTDERMRRYFISQKAAAEFILRAMEEGVSGEVWIPDMKEEFVVDVGVRIAEAAKVQYDRPAYDSAGYRLIGMQPHENLQEALWGEEEAPQVETRDGAFVIARR